MEVFWIIITSVVLLSYGFGILFFNNKMSKIAEADSRGLNVGTRQVVFRVSRRSMQTILGLIWFFDGVFQLKPQMFNQAFIKQVILPTGQGQPLWISALVNWGGHLVVGHLAIWNTLFAVIQLALGVCMIFNFKIKQTIIASLVWSALVWIFGEGVGQLFTGQSLLLNGAPGAVLIYGLVGIAIYPKNEGDTREWRSHSIRFSQLSLGILLAAGFAMHLQPAYLSLNGFSQVIAVPWLAKTIGNGGAVISILLGFLELTLAGLFFCKFGIRFAVGASIVLFTLYWWAGQSFGQIFDPLATDFNSGLLMILLAICSKPELININMDVESQRQLA